MAGSGGAMADAFINLGDKLHRNFNDTTSLLGGLRQKDEDLDLQNQAMDLKRQQWAIQKMLEQQKVAAGKNELDWMSGFRNAAANYRG